MAIRRQTQFKPETVTNKIRHGQCYRDRGAEQTRIGRKDVRRDILPAVLDYSGRINSLDIFLTIDCVDTAYRS